MGKVENIEKLMHTNVAGKDYGPVSFATRGNRLFVWHKHHIIFTAGSSGRAVVRLLLATEADPIGTALSQDERNPMCGQSAHSSLSDRPWSLQVQVCLHRVGFSPLRVNVLPPVSDD